MTHIFHNGEPVAPGEDFEPMPGYKVRYIRCETRRIVLRDASGEFTRPITQRSDPFENIPPHKPRLGERRTLVEAEPDPRPMTGDVVYLMTHQICVAGGWENIVSRKLRAPEGYAGSFGPFGQMMDSTLMRRAAADLCKDADEKLADHPYNRLEKLLTTVRLQEGHGDVGGWDDPSVVMEIAELLEKSQTI